MNNAVPKSFSIPLVILAAAVILGGPACSRRQPVGYALAIGLNQVDPNHYGGWSGNLTGCEPDAEDMRDIAQSRGLTTTTLKTGDATRKAVLDHLDDMAAVMSRGDLLVVSFSGHGGQVPDGNGDESDDGLDETWCLYDGQLLDDELHGAWMKFRPGVRILLFSDSCHSGTVLKMLRMDFESPKRIEDFESRWRQRRQLLTVNRESIRSVVESHPELLSRIPSASPGIERSDDPSEEGKAPPMVYACRAAPPVVLVQTYMQNKSFYRDLGASAPREDNSPLKASVILISGCEDDQSSADLGFNGLFTWTLKQVMEEGDYADYYGFHRRIRNRVLDRNSGQCPNLYPIGRRVEEFLAEMPYTLH